MLIAGEIIERIKADKNVRFDLCREFDIEHTTLIRWLSYNNILLQDIRLQTPGALRIICKAFDVTMKQILVDTPKEIQK